ncbi:hypothetical protein BC940DRAFT_370137 [Gongronella butleri]|nr:hypothetical protein BC940DRAFT_370137 [Gongronella butleri]
MSNTTDPIKTTSSSTSTSSQLPQPLSFLDTSFSTLSLDQLSNYARRASHSFSPQNAADDTQAYLADKAQKVQRGADKSLLLCLNGSAMGLSRISEHIHKRVPEMVDQAHQWQAKTEQVQRANADLQDASATLSTLQRIDSFAHMDEMLDRCDVLLQKLNNS